MSSISMNYDLRGKCYEYSVLAVRVNSKLTLVRGTYHCPIWGPQQHWWTKYPDGRIYDPTRAQFPSLGSGDYEEFNGMVSCEVCGNEMKEEDAYFIGRYPVCKGTGCARKLIGV